MPAVETSDVVARLRTAGCVFAEDEAELLISAAGSPTELDAMVARRVDGTPLEQILGWAEFHGLRIVVSPGVFVPRRRSEILVDEALELVWASGSERPVVVDLCCGTGAVGAAVGMALGAIELHAADLDPVEVACAATNIAMVGGRAYTGDLFAPLPPALRGRVDIVVANAPYVPTDEIGLMPPEARLYEPDVALNGGPDGLDLHRRIAADAADWLVPGGHLLIETSVRQAPASAEILLRNRFRVRVAHSDDLDGSCVIGTAPATATPRSR